MPMNEAEQQKMYEEELRRPRSAGFRDVTSFGPPSRRESASDVKRAKAKAVRNR